MAIDINIPSQVRTFANLAAFPASGALKTIYIAEDTNKTYRWTGSVYVEVSAAGATGITIGTTAITSGTVGRVLFQGTGNVVSQSANLFWDNTNGTLEATTTADNLFGLRLKSITGQLRVKPYLNSTYGVLLESKTADGSANLPLSLSGSRLLLLDGNVLINTTTDAGFRLDVNGTARVQGLFTAGNGFNLFTSGAAPSSHYLEATSSTATDGLLNFRRGGGPNGLYRFQLAGLQINSNNTTGENQIYSAASFFTTFYSNNIERMRIFTTGNIGINTTTDAGFKLDVNGTARVGSTLTVGSPAGSGLINICRTDNAVMTTISSPDVCIINNAQGSGVRLNTDNVTYLHVRGFASQFAANVTGTLTANAGFTRALLINNIINANANNNELAAIYINPTFNNNIYTGVKNIAIQSTIGGAHFNTTAVNDSAVLQADSTTKGFLPPRMTTAQKNAIASPAAGLMVYDTTLNVISYYNGTSWI